MVPTADTVKYCYLLETLVLRGNNTIIVGDTGVGKTNIIQNFIKKLNTDKYLP